MADANETERAWFLVQGTVRGGVVDKSGNEREYVVFKNGFRDELEEYHERTCRVESSEYDECCECFTTKLSCGCTVIDGWGFGGRYCPNCGAKVVDE